MNAKQNVYIKTFLIQLNLSKYNPNVSTDVYAITHVSQTYKVAVTKVQTWLYSNEIKKLTYKIKYLI